MDFQHIRLDRSRPVWVLTIDRPDVRNAVGRPTFEEIDRAISLTVDAAECRALVLTAAGADFIAGGDIKELRELTRGPEVEAWSRRAKTILERFSRLPVPVIGAIEGHAVGGGCEVALACDLRVAAASARFSFWEIRNAVTTGWGGGRRLLDLAGRAGALELLLTGDTIDAAKAHAMGIVNQVAPDGQALASAIQLAERIAAQPPLAVKAMKELIYGLPGLTGTEANDLETRLFVGTWLSEDHAEAVTAFFQRRRPVWRGR